MNAHDQLLAQFGQALGLPLVFDANGQCLLMLDEKLMISIRYGDVQWTFYCMLAQQPLAEKLMNSVHAQPEGELDELRMELRGVLNRILIDHIKQETHATAMAIASDPHAAQRLRDLYARLQFLENETRNAS